MTDAEKALKWCAELIADTDELLPDSSDALKRELVEQKECAQAVIAELARLTEIIRKTDTECDYCKHKLDGECDAAGYDCESCSRDCKCKTCRDNSNWEFL